jgi:hypothetical protein
MQNRAIRLSLLTALLCVAALLAWTVFLCPQHPIALLRVVDGVGKPIAGAVILPEGLRTKPGPYVSGWYGWRVRESGIANDPVKTDAEGFARVPYPKYVFERIETGTLCLSVEHPDYVPDRPERIVALAPPAGAPWRVWADYVWYRLQHKALVARPDPVVLQKGGVLKLSVKPGSAAPRDLPLFAQISGLRTQDANFWLRPGPGLLMTRRLRPGRETIRAIQFDSNGSAWFSPVASITSLAGQTNELAVELKPGIAVHGRLDDTVPQPVRNGRVVAHVWPQGEQPQNSPPDWHAWSNIRADGTFDITSLPEGQLEIVALCDGFVSTNGPGQFPSMHYPQKHLLGTNDLALTLGMEPTACLEIQVTDDQRRPLKDARVITWPNVRYGEWSATILGGDCYNTADFLHDVEKKEPKWWLNRPASFQGTSDVSGLALILNLPLEVKELSVEHPRFILPAAGTGFGQKRRAASITLQPGRTNRVSVRLEPAGQSPIAHY